MKKYKSHKVYKTPKWFPFRGWFSFRCKLYLNPVIYNYWISKDVYAQSEAIKTLEHEYTHIKQYRAICIKLAKYVKFNFLSRSIGSLWFVFCCLPVYSKSKIEKSAVYKGNLAANNNRRINSD